MPLSRMILCATALLSISAVLAGCGTSPSPTDATHRAEANVAEASRAGPVDLYGVVTEDELRDMPTQRLVELLGNDLAWTRLAAARVLAGRGPDSAGLFVDRLGDEDWRVVRAAEDGLLAMLRQETKDGSETAPVVRRAAIAHIGALTKNLKHEHYYVRMGALQCLGALGADAAPAGDAICDCTDDPDYLGVVPTAFRTIREVGPSNFDAKRLFAVMEKSVKSTDIDARKAAIDLIEKLDETDQRKLIPAMLYALDHQMVDGYTRFHVQAQIARLLQKLNVRETLPRIIAILKIKGWGESHRVKLFIPLLAKYGPDAAEALPMLEDYIRIFKQRHTNPDLVVQIEEMIQAIKNNDKTGGQVQ